MSNQDIPKVKTSGVSSPSAGASFSSQEGFGSSGTGVINTEEEELEEDADETTDSQDEEEKPDRPSPYFDTVDVMFYMSLAVVGDVFDGIWVTRIFFAPTTLLFLYFKGADQMISRNAVSQFIELIPMLGWLPISTTMAVYTIVMTNHPEYLEKLGTAGEVLKKMSKKGK